MKLKTILLASILTTSITFADDTTQPTEESKVLLAKKSALEIAITEIKKTRSKWRGRIEFGSKGDSHKLKIQSQLEFGILENYTHDIYKTDKMDGVDTQVLVQAKGKMVTLTTSGQDDTYSNIMTFKNADGSPTSLSIYVKVGDLDGMTLELFGIETKISGIMNAKTLVVTGDCSLKQEVLNVSNIMSGNGPTQTMEDSICEYDMTYNKDSKKFEFNFVYDSMGAQDNNE